MHHRRLTFDNSELGSIESWRAHMLLIHGDDESQRAVPTDNRSDRKTARPKSRVRRANHPRRNSRPAPLERFGAVLPRDRRILRPQIGCLGRTAIGVLPGNEGSNPTRFGSPSEKLTSASNRSPVSEERFCFDWLASRVVSQEN